MASKITSFFLIPDCCSRVRSCIKPFYSVVYYVFHQKQWWALCWRASEKEGVCCITLHLPIELFFLPSELLKKIIYFQGFFSHNKYDEVISVTDMATDDCDTLQIAEWVTVRSGTQYTAHDKDSITLQRFCDNRYIASPNWRIQNAPQKGSAGTVYLFTALWCQLHRIRHELRWNDV